jgi:hypothetical protein
MGMVLLKGSIMNGWACRVCAGHHICSRRGTVQGDMVISGQPPALGSPVSMNDGKTADGMACASNRGMRLGYLVFVLMMVLRSFAGLAIAQQSPNPSGAAEQEKAAGSEPPSPSAGSTLAPSRQQIMRDYVMDTVGPYPIVMATFTAAIHQGTNNPPEWGQGAGPLAQRFGSNMGITAVSNTTRLGLAAAFHQNTSYVHCSCRGVFPRLRHATVYALMARRRSDGKQVFSIPNLVAPYAATMTATYAWYPERYGAKDAFRMGNYNLLGTVGSNIAFEFVPKKAWEMLGRVHLSSRRSGN